MSKARADALKGFTLPEVIVTTAVVVLVGSLLITILANNTNLFYHQSVKVSEGLGTNDATLSVRAKLKEAVAVTASYPLEPTYFSDPTHLILKLPSLDGTGTINGSFDFCIFSKEGDKLRMQVFPDVSSQRKREDQIIAFNISNLLFEYFDKQGSPIDLTESKKVRMTITVEQNIGSKPQEHTAVSEVELRND